MKIVETIDLISRGDFPSSRDWRSACRHVNAAVKATDWPHGSGTFTIYPESGKKRGEGNGVVPIKLPCLKKLRDLGWQVEQLPVIEKGVIETGDLDGLLQSGSGFIGFEWETGNISSSHRVMNKLLLLSPASEKTLAPEESLDFPPVSEGRVPFPMLDPVTMKLGGLVGGFLVVPSNKLKIYLTDRVSNIGELRHYFSLWQDTEIKEGALRIIVAEHDATSHDVPRIPKGTSGRALQ